MTDETPSLADASRLGEDAAHRLLARAVELDTARGGTLTVAQLREVAREAGISAGAFEAALRELGEGTAAPRAAMPAPRRRVSWPALGGALGGAVARNALALVGGWVAISVPSGMTNAAGAGWEVHQGAVIAGNVLAALLARRLGARAVAVLWGVTAAAQLAEYPIHLLAGIETVQGGPTKWALILASLLGIGFGALLRRGRHGAAGSALPQPQAETPAAPAPSERPRLGALRLRHA